jgi:hypothetical protein
MGGSTQDWYASRSVYVERWLTIPHEVTFFNIIDPYNMEPSPEPDSEPAGEPMIEPQVEERPTNNYFQVSFEGAAGLEALSTAATNSLPYIRPLLGPEQPSSQSSNNLNFILNPEGPSGSIGESRHGCAFANANHFTAVSSPVVDPVLTTSVSPPSSEYPVVNTHEIAFLLRHFGETAGQWYDYKPS